MANGATTPSRLGEIDATGDDYALFLKKFSGEVMTTFAETNVMMDKHRVRTISSGKSAQFPAIGTATAGYHVPGTDILDAGTSPSNLSVIHHAERVISIDNLLLSSVFIQRIDEAMNHYDVRGPYATELGRALAKSADITLLRVAIIAGKTASPTIAEQTTKVGSVIDDADFATNPMSTVDTVFAIAQKFDEKDVPAEDRYLAVPPGTYLGLIKAAASRGQLEGVGGTLDVDIQRTSFPGLMGQMDVGGGRVYSIAGIQIVKTNHIPTTNLGSVTGSNNTYTVDARNTVGVAWQKEAFGTVKLLDLAMESEYLITHQGTLFVAKYAMGHGVLRPECAIQVRTAAP